MIVDLEDYACAYPELVTSGGRGSLVRLQWAEALREEPDKWNFAKGNRDEIEGKLLPRDGRQLPARRRRERRFETLWFASGRYLEIVVRDRRRAAERSSA